MAEGEKFPNLKICIDNTESDDDNVDIVSLHEEDDIEEREERSDIEDSDGDEVEFNVRLGNLPKNIEDRSKSNIFRKVTLIFLVWNDYSRSYFIFFFGIILCFALLLL